MLNGTIITNLKIYYMENRLYNILTI